MYSRKSFRNETGLNRIFWSFHSFDRVQEELCAVQEELCAVQGETLIYLNCPMLHSFFLSAITPLVRPVVFEQKMSYMTVSSCTSIYSSDTSIHNMKIHFYPSCATPIE